jgi:hypothetical protein
MRKLFEITDGHGWEIEVDNLTAAKTAATEHAGRPLHWITTSYQSDWNPAEWYGYDHTLDPWEDDIDASSYRVRLVFERPDGVRLHRPDGQPIAG